MLRRLWRPRAAEQDPADGKSGFTRPATWDDVLRTARLLNDAGVRYVLVGGYAWPPTAMCE